MWKLLYSAAFFVGIVVPMLDAAAREDEAGWDGLNKPKIAAQTDCLSLNRYNEAAEWAMRKADWNQVPEAAKLPHGTRSSMSEFLVFKEAQRQGVPPCPDLASVHKEFGMPAATEATPQRPDMPKMLDPTKARRSAVAPRSRVTVTGNARIRKEPSRSAQSIRIVKKGETLAVFGAEHGWVSVGTRKSEGWVLAAMLKQ